MRTLIIVSALLLSACSIRVYNIEYHMHDGNHVSFEAKVEAEVPKKIDAAANVEASIIPEH